MKKKIFAGLACGVIMLGVVGMASANSFVIMVGDNDGYGLGIAENGSGTWSSYTPQDWRSSAEKTAIDGSQVTDIYGALWDSPPTSVDIIFNLSGTMTSATLTVDMADAQAIPIGISYNGIAQSEWVYNDGYQMTMVRSYSIDMTSISNANADGEFILTIGTNAPVWDFLAFDYFKLEGEYDAAPVPEPATMLLMGTGLAGLVGLRRKKKK